MASVTPGRILITLGNMMYALGAFAADFNTTHVFNPRWPPHAKFHNGQTMTLGILLSVTSLAFLWKSAHARDVTRARESLWWAAMIGSFYCAAGCSAILYPGTEWTDPEFVVEGQWTQGSLFGGIVVAMWVGYALESWRLG